MKKTTKAGQSWGYVTLNGVGDVEVDGSEFTIKLVSIDDLGGGVLKYNITVTSDDISGGQGGTKSLSHVEFDFGKYCPIEINTGAILTADSFRCSLEAITESISIKIDENGVIIYPTLPYSTPWAEDFCEFCCDC